MTEKNDWDKENQLQQNLHFLWRNTVNNSVYHMLSRASGSDI